MINTNSTETNWCLLFYLKTEEECYKNHKIDKDIYLNIYLPLKVYRHCLLNSHFIALKFL